MYLTRKNMPLHVAKAKNDKKTKNNLSRMVKIYIHDNVFKSSEMEYYNLVDRK